MYKVVSLQKECCFLRKCSTIFFVFLLSSSFSLWKLRDSVQWYPDFCCCCVVLCCRCSFSAGYSGRVRSAHLLFATSWGYLPCQHISCCCTCSSVTQVAIYEHSLSAGEAGPLLMPTVQMRGWEAASLGHVVPCHCLPLGDLFPVMFQLCQGKTLGYIQYLSAPWVLSV